MRSDPEEWPRCRAWVMATTAICRRGNVRTRGEESSVRLDFPARVPVMPMTGDLGFTRASRAPNRLARLFHRRPLLEHDMFGPWRVAGVQRTKGVGGRPRGTRRITPRSCEGHAPTRLGREIFHAIALRAPISGHGAALRPPRGCARAPLGAACPPCSGNTRRAA